MVDPRKRGSGWSLQSLRQSWRTAEPWQRRNALIGTAVVVWAGLLTADMVNLKKDPRFREKLQLSDDPEKPQPSFASLWYDWINRKFKRSEDY